MIKREISGFFRTTKLESRKNYGLFTHSLFRFPLIFNFEQQQQQKNEIKYNVFLEGEAVDKSISQLDILSDTNSYQPAITVFNKDSFRDF